MRDVNRIDPTLEALAKFWRKFPDWRLGQLLCNVGRQLGSWDSFYLDDDKLREFLEMANEKPELLKEIF